MDDRNKCIWIIHLKFPFIWASIQLSLICFQYIWIYNFETKIPTYIVFISFPLITPKQSLKQLELQCSMNIAHIHKGHYSYLTSFTISCMFYPSSCRLGINNSQHFAFKLRAYWKELNGVIRWQVLWKSHGVCKLES